MNANELADKLEAKAKLLRESGLSQDELDSVAGGRYGGCVCCGSTCSERTKYCMESEAYYDRRPESCMENCIGSSPD